MVVGAGAMARGMASFLADAGVSELVIANRSADRAEHLASTLAEPRPGTSIRGVELTALSDELRGADVLLTATAAVDAVVSVADVQDALADRVEPLLVVDVGMPRDVDPAVGELDGVEVLDMETVATLTDANLAARHAETDAVRTIVDEEIRRFAAEVNAREVAPVVTALREQADVLRRAELERFASRLEGLDPEQREAVEALTRGMFAKLLHGPTVRLKDAAGSSRGDRLADSVRDLFDLS